MPNTTNSSLLSDDEYIGGFREIHPTISNPRHTIIATIKYIFGIALLEVKLANTKSAKKRILQNEKRRIRNREVMSRTRTYVKHARASISEGDFPTSEEAVRKAISELDRAASKGVIHKNNAARRKSRLMAHLNELKSDEGSSQ